VDVAANTNDTTGTTYASGKAAFDEIYNSQRTLIEAINVCRNAVGLSDMPIARNLLGSGTPDLTDGINGGDAATNGVTTDATTIASALTEANVEILFNNLRDNVSFFADQLDAIYDRDSEYLISTVPALVADTSSAGSIFVNSPVGGRIRNVHAQTTVAVTTADNTTTYELDGSAVSGASLVIAAAGSAVGIHDVDAVADSGDPGDATANFVYEGQDIELVNDGGGDTGAALFWVDIAPTFEDKAAMAAFRG